ncbi:MAG: hypothetical protein M5U34_13260 [Chloroflexi bacterium]|nr:hypothetical protein [Chloroflexota bacterium]
MTHQTAKGKKAPGGSMIQTNGSNMNDYYTTVKELGKLRTLDHAERWSEAILHTLALNLDKGNKRN